MCQVKMSYQAIKQYPPEYCVKDTVMHYNFKHL